MTCREARRRLEHEERGDARFGRDEALAHHLVACHRCRETGMVARLAGALLGALREEIDPGPAFYARLRKRLAEARVGQAEAALLQAWGVARRLVPAVALGVLVLAGVTISLGRSRPPSPLRPGLTIEFQAFSPDGLSSPEAVERPSPDQILAFVLTTGADEGTPSVGSGAGSGE